MTVEGSRSSARPIILVGMNRTGTKWVSNILCSHDEIMGIQSERARGILETNMFGIMQAKFDLSYPDEYIGLIELWSSTELFKLAGIEKAYFYDQPVRPSSVFAVFELLMSEVARRANRSYWLQKTSPLRAEAVLRYFSSALIVVVRRNLLDTLRSTWRLNQRHGRRRIFRSTFAYVRQKKAMDRITRRRKTVEVDYDALKADPLAETRRLLQGLGLDSGGITGRTEYQKNTSFERQEQRKAIMSKGEEILVVSLAFLIHLIPLVVIDRCVAVKHRIIPNGPPPLMPGSFGALFDRLKDQKRKNVR